MQIGACKCLCGDRISLKLKRGECLGASIVSEVPSPGRTDLGAAAVGCTVQEVRRVALAKNVERQDIVTDKGQKSWGFDREEPAVRQWMYHAFY